MEQGYGLRAEKILSARIMDTLGFPTFWELGDCPSITVVMNTGLARLDTFSELYVYSSGYIGEQQKAFEDNFGEMFKDAKTNDLFRVPLYMAAGETNIALKNSQAALAVINKYGIRNFWVFSDGGHDWQNWRRCLYQTAQIMFPDCPAK